MSSSKNNTSSAAEIRIERLKKSNNKNEGYHDYQHLSLLSPPLSPVITEEEEGFEYSEEKKSDDDIYNERHQWQTSCFHPPLKIIGATTSCNQPRSILSPPQMKYTLLQHVPKHLSTQNLWLKYSLLRDGAHLNILKQYAHTSSNTLLVIETTTGEIFGSFTSSYWHTQPSYFGTGEAFLWKIMIIAKEESQSSSVDIDVYPFSHLNSYVQLCTSDRLAVGGGGGDDGSPDDKECGFGFSIDEDLLYGTSSPCATFCSPCLSTGGRSKSDGGGVFEIVNMEVWTFSPLENVADAERLEMTKFYEQEHAMSSNSPTSSSLQ